MRNKMKFQELLAIARIANPDQSEVWLKTYVAYLAVSLLPTESLELMKETLSQKVPE